MKHLLFIFLGFLIHSSSFASELAQTADSSACSVMVHIQDVVQCVLVQDVRVLELKSQEQVATLKQGAASYWPNPNVAFKAGAGQSLGDLLTQVEFTVGFPVELGGKKNSRIALANAEMEQVRIEKEVGTLEILIDTYSRVLKIKELYVQEKSLVEALQFVQKVSKLYQSRPHLDPEQVASKHLFELMKQQYNFQLILISKNREAQLNELLLMTQNQTSKANLKELIYKLPPPSWPDLGEHIAGNSLWLRQLQAEAMVVEKKYDLEVSKSFPDVELGPYYAQDYQGPVLTDFFGIAVSFPFPVFNINSGGRALAKASMQSALYKKRLMEVKEELEIKLLLQDYKSMTAELAKMGPLLEKFQKSNPTMSLFERGLIPATYAIESQRSHQELVRTAHELELKNLEILFKIKSIAGNFDAGALTLWPR